MTFSGYADNLLHKHIKPYLEHVERVDVVFDVYKTDSLKLGIRIKRGDGVRHHVVAKWLSSPKLAAVFESRQQ